MRPFLPLLPRKALHNEAVFALFREKVVSGCVQTSIV